METFLAYFKIFPTIMGALAFVGALNFWKGNSDHEYLLEVLIAIGGMIGSFLTWGLFSNKSWSGKVFLLSIFVSMTSATWGFFKSNWQSQPIIFALIAALTFVYVILTPAEHFGSIERRQWPYGF